MYKRQEYIRENPENFRDYRFDCSGFFHYEDYTIKCYHETAHGSQDFVRAFANSCNGAFANLALTCLLYTSGADAVYIGGSRFGARAYADNPEEDRLLEAVSYTHLDVYKRQVVHIFIQAST